MAKIWIIAIIIGAIVLTFSLAWLFGLLETRTDNVYEAPKSSYIHKTISITSIRTPEQYAGLQKGFTNEAEIAACQYDLHEQEKIDGKYTLNSVAQQPDENYIFVCSCGVWFHT